jgi:hypothetical protein
MDIVCSVALPILSAFQSAIDLAFSVLGNFVNKPRHLRIFASTLGC